MSNDPIQWYHGPEYLMKLAGQQLKRESHEEELDRTLEDSWENEGGR